MGVVLANAVKVLNKEGFSVKIGAVAGPTPPSHAPHVGLHTLSPAATNKIVSTAQSLINAYSLCATAIAHRTTGKSCSTMGITRCLIASGVPATSWRLAPLSPRVSSTFSLGFLANTWDVIGVLIKCRQVAWYSVTLGLVRSGVRGGRSGRSGLWFASTSGRRT